MPDINRLKRELRRHYRQIRDSLSVEERQIGDETVLNNLLELEQYKNASVVLTYVSTGSETGTDKLIAQAIMDGKKVACPLCDKESKTMVFRCIGSLDELVAGAYGISEPQPDAPAISAKDMADSVCIVPGLAFDASGGRLGYGGGYYDRFLSGYSGVSIGLCRAGCLSKQTLPRDRYDICVDLVISG